MRARPLLVRLPPICQGFLLLAILFGSACKDPASNREKTNPPKGEEQTQTFPYRLDQPDLIRDLPEMLREISGLAWMEEEVLASVQDEKGKVYFFDMAENEIRDEVKFAGKGDFEGLAVHDGELWIVRSDGKLFHWQGKDNVASYGTELDEKDEVEGLCWDDRSNRLLIACKRKKGRIHAFSPKTGEMDKEAGFAPDWEKGFRPAGIAVHPGSGDLYVVSAVGEMLAVFSRETETVQTYRIEIGGFAQPEGICFAPDGRLYIASEGKGGKGKIMRFDPQ